jgi:hypothetical protein
MVLVEALQLPEYPESNRRMAARHSLFTFMATRALVSYDDITLPYQPTKPPPKKRRKNQQKAAPEEAFTDPNDYEEGEESRELTHEEIWDDSALLNAWEAATDEYEAYHGSQKAWKTETVNKAPL